MAYARKIPIKILQLSSFDDYFNYLWKIFCRLSRGAERTDVIFDVYTKNSTKMHERQRRSKILGVRTKIAQYQQRLPIDMDGFWSCEDNKVNFKNQFINWIKHKYTNNSSLYLGGSHSEDQYKCVLLKGPTETSIRLLYCLHEEADDRIMYHVTHSVKVDKVSKVVVASADTDVFIVLVHNYGKWLKMDLKELWCICGTGSTKKAVPIHILYSTLGPDIAHILPALHAVSGTDTTPKVGTKSCALRTVKRIGPNLLKTFGIEQLNEDMMVSTEKFMVGFFTDSSEICTFDQLRHEFYYKNKKSLNLKTFPPTSNSIRTHIKLSYLQTYRWVNAAWLEDFNNLDPLSYGYVNVVDENILKPDVITEKLPPDFPVPCICLKCARDTVCPCRVKEIKCSAYCKCRREEMCRNPH